MYIFCHDRGIPENVFNQFPGQMPNTENVHPHMMGQTGGIEVSNYNYIYILYNNSANSQI